MNQTLAQQNAATQNPTPVPVTIARGDGIGPEIMAATLQVLDAAGARLQIEEIDIPTPSRLQLLADDPELVEVARRHATNRLPVRMDRKDGEHADADRHRDAKGPVPERHGPASAGRPIAVGTIGGATAHEAIGVRSARIPSPSRADHAANPSSRPGSSDWKLRSGTSPAAFRSAPHQRNASSARIIERPSGNEGSNGFDHFVLFGLRHAPVEG
jgi:hypothetical protein